MLTTRRIVYAVVVNALVLLSFRDVVYLFSKQPPTSSNAQNPETQHDAANVVHKADISPLAGSQGLNDEEQHGSEDALAEDSEFADFTDRERVVHKPKLMMDGGVAQSRANVVTINPLMSVLYCHS